MTKFQVKWTKCYYITGVVEVEADHEDDAHDLVLENIGDYEGSLQYDNYGDSAEVLKGGNDG